MKKKGSNFTKQKGGIIPMAMLGPALMIAGPGKKVVKYAGKKNHKKFEEKKHTSLNLGSIKSFSVFIFVSFSER